MAKYDTRPFAMLGGVRVACGVLLLASSLAGCGVSFERRTLPVEEAMKAELRVYYSKVQDVFKDEDADALASLFDPAITQPMTHEQILDWGRKFFAQYQGVRFHVERLIFEDLGPGAAAVKLAYRVTTLGGKGDFGGVERDTLAKVGGRWRMTAWEKLK